ncbi:hypothetical protein KR044_001401 [Drosophila immigrans]|nr:hypothetical protein KR044_001401 [Drosophila immigrans]
MLQQCIIKSPNGALGLNLSRAPWDPYPWVSGVQAESNAQLAGVRIGDTLLQLNGNDVLGMRISELANRLREHWLTGAEHATMMMWRQQPTTLSTTDDPNEAAHAVQHGINQQSLQKFATCLQHIAQLLECPVCCDVVKPPGWQCCNGHVLCNNCRNRSVKCPVCRVPLGPRGRCLLSDKLFTLLAENFPCDGVKINKDAERNNNNNSNSSSRSIENSNAKCTNEYHNQPKMALAKSNSGKKCRKTSRQMQEDTVILVVNGAGEEQAKEQTEEKEEKEVKQCVKQVSGMPKGNEQSAQIRNNVNDAGLQRGVIKSQQAGNSAKQLPGEEEGGRGAEESNNMLVKPKLKLSKKSWQITGRDQDELRCDEVANINNGQQRMLGLGMPEQEQEQEEESRGLQLGLRSQVLEPSKGQQQYQNYHCPTGKSCCSQAKLFQPASANKLSTVKRESATATATAAPEKRLGAVAEIAFVAAANSAATLSAGSHKGAPKANGDAETLAQLLNGPSIKTLLNSQLAEQHLELELQLELERHLSREHQLNVVHFDGTFGQRLHVHVQLRPQQTQICLRLSEPTSGSRGVQTFFLALLPVHDKHAVFLWHLNAAQSAPSQQFQTVIEAQCNRVKWFGQAQPLTRSWPEICAAGQFLSWMNEGQQSCTAFEITVKRK